MTLKHKGNGYDATAVVDTAAGICAEKCGCSDSQFRSCAQRFTPTAKTPETAVRVFADWHSTKGFADVKHKMDCDSHRGKGKGATHRSSAPTSAQVAA